MVTTARASATASAAASTAAPPRLWPIRSDGARARRAQVVGGGDQVGDVGRERGVGEFALARADAGEVEAQHRDALRVERLRDAPRRQHVLAAGEAMGEQRIGARLAGRQVEHGGELLAAGIGEIETLGGMAGLPVRGSRSVAA